MGFLAPLFLIAGALVAVPIILHLFQRQESRRIAFPAVRYLLRTEKDHARRIRLRQLLLLLVRVAAVVLLTLVGARLFVQAQGGAHDPTALAMVIDNSMSSGVVIDGVRTLDRLKEAARASVDEASPDDRIWVIPAGEPWEVSEPLSPAAAARRIDALDVSDAFGDLGSALRRASELLGPALSSEEIEASEIHLFSDLQASALPELSVAEWVGSHPLLVFTPEASPPDNRGLLGGLVGGGLPPVVNQRTEFTVQLQGPPSDTVAVRLVIDDRIRGASTASPGGSAVLSGGPFAEGWVVGHLESDRDALLADDRFPFAFRVEPPPLVTVRGTGSLFLESALAVLAEEGRLRTGPGESGPGSEVIIGVAGEGVDSPRPGQRTIVLPPEDPSVLPAVNRRLAAAGIPWSYRTVDPDEERSVAENRIPVDLAEIGIRRRYALEPADTGDPLGDVHVRLDNGDPWLVTGEAGDHPYLLLGSPLDPDATELPVSAQMIPFLQWAMSTWTAASPASSGVEAGTPLSLPSGATEILLPDGTTRGVDGTRLHLSTGRVGVYTVMAGDSILEHIAVVPPAAESVLERSERERVEAAFGEELWWIDRVSRWEGTIFRARRGPELWRPLLAALLAVLLLESWIASSGQTTARRAPVTRAGPTPQP